MSNNNSIVWAIQKRPKNDLLVNLTDKLLANKKKLAKNKLYCHLDIVIHLERVKLSIRDKIWKVSERRIRKVLGGYLISSSVI